MSVYKRGNIWWCKFTLRGIPVRETTRALTRKDAEEYERKRREEVWAGAQLGRQRYQWEHAVLKWLETRSGKRDFEKDKSKLRWLHKHLKGRSLQGVDNELVHDVLALKTEASPTTKNRYIALVRAILNAAVDEWKMLDRAPKIHRATKKEAKRVRWESREVMERVLARLPRHSRLAADFTLQTGLRESNVTGLIWPQINWKRREARIPRTQVKNDAPLTVPLNSRAMEILRELQGDHRLYVFTYRKKRIGNFNTRAYKKALAAEGVTDFRWHDLRHTWATWHILSGTSIYELQRLGGWKTLDMVLRYAHTADEYLHQAADRLVQNRAQSGGENNGSEQKAV